MAKLKQCIPRPCRRFLHAFHIQTRMLNAARRAWPSFLIIGAQRAGTTSLYHWLNQHPALQGSCPKEVHYYDGGLWPDRDNYTRGERWYRAHFPLNPRSKNHAYTLAFEASPSYLFYPLAAQRIYADMPNIKLIALLRDPVARAISHYRLCARLGHETLPMEEALEAEPARLEHAWKTGDFNHSSFLHHSYLARGRYLEQLKRYAAIFPRASLLVLQSEYVFKDPLVQLRRIFTFLNVDTACVPADLGTLNTNKYRPVGVASVFEKKLYTYFAPHNQALFEWLGESFDWPTPDAH